MYKVSGGGGGVRFADFSDFYLISPENDIVRPNYWSQ